MPEILLVDDEESVLQTVGTLLRTQGYEVTAVREGEKGAELISSGNYDVIITDIRMAPVDGMKLLQIAHDAQPETPVIVISAYTSEKTIKQSYQLGCKAYIKKPFRIEQVLDAVKDVLPQGGSQS
ncbi:MAG: response regulator [Kiritimatiellia bacterium]